MTDTTRITSSYEGHDRDHNHAHHPTIGVYLSVFAALMVLLVVTVVVAEMEFGAANFLVAAGIASLKALLIILFFMHVRYSTPLVWLVAGTGFVFLAIMFAFSFADYFTRTGPLLQ